VDVAHGGKAAGEEGGPYSYDDVLVRPIRGVVKCVPVRLVANRVSARVQAIVGVVWSGEWGMGLVLVVKVLRSSKFLGPRSSGEPITCPPKSANTSEKAGCHASGTPR
jgi:hypothetical protein